MKVQILLLLDAFDELNAPAPFEVLCSAASSGAEVEATL